jgi:hypothetical protein
LIQKGQKIPETRRGGKKKEEKKKKEVVIYLVPSYMYVLPPNINFDYNSEPLFRPFGRQPQVTPCTPRLFFFFFFLKFPKRK